MCVEVLSAEEGVHGEFRGDFFRAVRNNSPTGDQQTEERGSTVRSLALHGLCALECKDEHTHTHTHTTIKSVHV